MRNYIRFRLSQESQSERISRLNRIHERLVCESTEEREHRLDVIRNRLPNETPEHRFYVINERNRTEIPFQRTQRLAAERRELAASGTGPPPQPSALEPTDE
ncbi:hypothetical protein EVAR_54841_1 [Eumeta japonica]|uniref:Uncharacterized protein n=1 Tax=Eumeta variegata TaxID=151549 RepID=A0A4C1ZI41_EUMVA|nr:hypothetical protein EVAR_54841_1 [Eumeta japonica]